MNPVDVIQKELIEEINSTGDGFEQYSYLLELSLDLPESSENLKREENLIKGCQSKVWISMRIDDDGKLKIEADSDTLIMRGLLMILYRMFEGQKMNDIADVKVSIFEDTELFAGFDSVRQKGIGYIIKEIQNYCSSKRRKG